MTSSPTSPIRPISSRGCYEDVAHVERLSPVQLATRLLNWSAGGLLCGVQCCPFVRVSCRSLNCTSPTHATCCGHPREDATTMLRGNCSRGISSLARVWYISAVFMGVYLPIREWQTGRTHRLRSEAIHCLQQTESLETSTHCKNIRIYGCFVASFPHINGTCSVYVCIRKSTDYNEAQAYT